MGLAYAARRPHFSQNSKADTSRGEPHGSISKLFFPDSSTSPYPVIDRNPSFSRCFALGPRGLLSQGRQFLERDA
jgi:hypothetical protein